MSEADLTYTRAIMGDGQIEIKGKDGWLIGTKNEQIYRLFVLFCELSVIHSKVFFYPPPPVLILGGGDGGILHESRMAGAKSVTMLEVGGL